jgi:aspartate aminotransferase-like enzyme
MKEYLLTAGPTPVPERVLQAMARPMLYHRSPPFTECLREVQDGLRWLLQTKQLPMLMSGSGTVGMDAAVCNFLRTGDKAIVIRGGKFGERWGKICQAYGIECVFIDVEWGKGVDPKAVAKALDENPGVPRGLRDRVRDVDRRPGTTSRRWPRW